MRHSSYAGENQRIYCDGACIPNPGYMGVGVVRVEPSFVISVYPGTGTNQVAELLALRIAIEIASPGAVIFTDSKYAYKEALAKWRAHANREVVRSIRNALHSKRVQILLMKRCSHPLHRLADQWAYRAAETREPRLELDSPISGLPTCNFGSYRPEKEPQADLLEAWVARVAAEAMRDPPVCEDARLDNADGCAAAGRKL